MTTPRPKSTPAAPAATRRFVAGPLVVRAVSVSAGGTSILTGISTTLQPGQLCALLGPSGAGKSTLIKVLLGLRVPSSGDVSLGGGPVSAAGAVGYVPQEDSLHGALTVERALAFAADLRLPEASAQERAARVDDVVAKVGLAERRRVRIAKLSGGQKKRVSVALELLTSPGLLILDEPTSGLDPGLEAQMMKLFSSLAREGRIVLVATHAMESLDVCDAMLLLDRGRVAYTGPPRDALARFGVDRYAAIFDVLAKRRAA